MTGADPIVKRTRCPHDDCDGDGTAVVPAGVEIVATAVENGETDADFDGIVYGHCPDHEFYAYYVVADESGDAG